MGDIIAVPTSRVVESLRAVKDEGERDAIRKAAAIADRAFERILEELRPGRTEREIALRLEFMMREMGADGASFDIIVASGPRSALPHGVASDRVLEKGDLVTLDFGASYRDTVPTLPGRWCWESRMTHSGGSTKRSGRPSRPPSMRSGPA